MSKKKLILLALLIISIGIMPGYAKSMELAAKMHSPLCLVIDAGHGGADSGAVAADGTVEKNINLQVAEALRQEATKYGIEVVMTREKDEGLYSPENEGQRWSKMGDLKERKRILEEAGADLVVSIHLNSFKQDTDVRGAQVFYPKGSEESKKIAELVQSCLIKGVDDGTERIVLAKDDLYLFRDLSEPMILVECGFLSNPQDLANLKEAAFQQKLANCMMNAIAETYNLFLQKSHKIQHVESRT